jgi:hypothetical protein
VKQTSLVVVQREDVKVSTLIEPGEQRTQEETVGRLRSGDKADGEAERPQYLTTAKRRHAGAVRTVGGRRVAGIGGSAEHGACFGRGGASLDEARFRSAKEALKATDAHVSVWT